MEMIYYTLAAVVLYGVSDYILNAIEIKLQKRLPNRSLVFFVIITVLALSTFAVIRALYEQPKQGSTTIESTVEQQPSAKAPGSVDTTMTPSSQTQPGNNLPADTSNNESQQMQSTNPPSM